MLSRRKTEQYALDREAKRAAQRAALLVPSRSLHRGTYSGGVSGEAVPKSQPMRSQKLRDSANGEDCLVRLPGCPQDPAKTIWSHYRGSAGGKSGARKSDDICGAYACTYCDAVYDGQHQRPEGMTKEDVDLAWHDGHIRSLVRLAEKGLLK